MDKIRQSPRLLRLVEIAAAWFFTELLVRITGTDAQFQMIDFRLMFVMLIGTVSMQVCCPLCWRLFLWQRAICGRALP